MLPYPPHATHALYLCATVSTTTSYRILCLLYSTALHLYYTILSSVHYIYWCTVRKGEVMYYSTLYLSLAVSPYLSPHLKRCIWSCGYIYCVDYFLTSSLYGYTYSFSTYRLSLLVYPTVEYSTCLTTCYILCVSVSLWSLRRCGVV